MSEMTRFAGGHSGHARWGPRLGLCLRCGNVARRRAAQLEGDRYVHSVDRGRIVLCPEKRPEGISVTFQKAEDVGSGHREGWYLTYYESRSGHTDDCWDKDTVPGSKTYHESCKTEKFELLLPGVKDAEGAVRMAENFFNLPPGIVEVVS